MNKKTFRDLHKKGDPFVLANAWDLGSARVLMALGAQAIGTSSAAHAFTLGRPDMGNVTRREALDHAKEIVDSVELPVSADLENGFDSEPAGVSETIKLAAECGLAGASIEDTNLPSSKPYKFDVAVARVEAAVRAARTLKSDFVLCARADGLMNGHYDLDEAIRRVQSFEKLGADCVFIPCIGGGLDRVAKVVESVKIPVNVLITSANADQTCEKLAREGVARISLGPTLARKAHRALIESAREIFEQGTFSQLNRVASGDEVDALLSSDP